MNSLKSAPNAMKSSPSKNLKIKKAMMNTAHFEEGMRSARRLHQEFKSVGSQKRKNGAKLTVC